MQKLITSHNQNIKGQSEHNKVITSHTQNTKDKNKSQSQHNLKAHFHLGAFVAICFCFEKALLFHGTI